MQIFFVHLTRLQQSAARGGRVAGLWLLTAGAAMTGDYRQPHNIHISYCRSELGANALTGKLTCYTDDLELAVKNETGVTLRSLAAPERPAALRTYLQKHFSATANSENGTGGAALTLTVPSVSEDGASYSIAFHFAYSPDAAGGADIRSLTIENRILLKEFKDQMNLLTVKAFGREQSFVFSSSKPNAALAP